MQTPATANTAPAQPAIKTAEATAKPESKTADTPLPTTAQEPKKYKIPGDKEGEEREVDEKEWRSSYELKKASYKRFEEAAGLRKQIDGLLQYVKQNPFDPKLKQIFGEDWDPEGLAEDLVIKKYERKQMTPEQQELQDLRDREKARELADEQAKKNYESAEFEKKVEAERQKIVSDFIPAIEKTGLPKNTESMRRMVHVLQMSKANDVILTPDQIAEQVNEDYAHELRSYAGAKKGDALLDLLGDELRKEIRKAEVARIRGGNPPTDTNTSSRPEIDQKLTGRRAYEARMAAMIKSGK